MNSEQIENALKKNASTTLHFRGVYARDTLPQKPRRGFYVVNLDKTGESGSHWVCMHIGKSSNTYFDSYGKKPPPSTQRDFAKFLGLKKRLEKTQYSFNRTSPPHAASGAFIIYGEHVMSGT